MAEVLQQLGSEHVIVVHGEFGQNGDAAGSSVGGMDEISISGPTRVAELKGGKVSEYSIAPADFGLAEAPLSTLQVSGAEQSLEMIHAVLQNQSGPARDIVTLNAGAAIHVGGAADSLQSGVELAAQSIANGAAKAKLDQLIDVTSQF